MKEKYCSGCKEKLEDGEIVAVNQDKEFYHHILRDLLSVPIDCSMKKTMEGAQLFNRKVYYNQKVYEISKLCELPNASQLTIEFNEKQTGDLIKGDLKGLSKKLFGIF